MKKLNLSPKKWALFASCQLLMAFSAVGATAGDQLVTSLLECSPDYFSQLRKTSEFSSAGYEINERGRVKVPDPRDEVGPGWRVMGTKPVVIGGLEVVGLYNAQRKANTFQTYDWGILVKGAPDELAETLNKRLPAEKTLESDGFLGFARLEKVSVSFWPNYRVQKPLPQRSLIPSGEIERVAEITVADEELPGISRIGCSIQGVIPQRIINKSRPDL